MERLVAIGTWNRSFNEAPPIQAGKRRSGSEHHAAPRASMRPHPFRRGNFSAAGKRRGARDGFNEAPPIQAGKPGSRDDAQRNRRRFNEAPPIQAGKQKPGLSVGRENRGFNEAPPIQAGKHAESGAYRVARIVASMRPHPFRRGNIGY